MLLKKLPKETVENIKETLKAYDKCNVIFENGKYNVRTGYCLQSSYAEDYKFIGEFSKDEVFTKREQIINYIEEFQCFPSEYKPQRNSYDILKKYTDGVITLGELVDELNI